MHVHYKNRKKELNHMLETEFKNKKPNKQKMLAFGFSEQDGCYLYSSNLADGQMKINITILCDNKIRTQVIDSNSGEEYILHCVPGAAGTFVGQIKTEHENLIEEISATCFDPDVFKSDGAKKVITYVRETYEDELEFLWKKFPDNAIWRRKDTKKWYGALLTVSKQKLGIDSEEAIEILDLREEPENIEKLINHKNYFPGYHMNKKHWYTVCLDGSVPFEEICNKIDISYNLAFKQK